MVVPGHSRVGYLHMLVIKNNCLQVSFAWFGVMLSISMCNPPFLVAILKSLPRLVWNQSDNEIVTRTFKPKMFLRLL